jgi:hypothetical protein
MNPLQTPRRIEITRESGRWVARQDDGELVHEGRSKTELVREVTSRVRESGEVAIVRVFAANGMFLEQRMYPRGEARRRKPAH